MLNNRSKVRIAGAGILMAAGATGLAAGVSSPEKGPEYSPVSTTEATTTTIPRVTTTSSPELELIEPAAIQNNNGTITPYDLEANQPYSTQVDEGTKPATVGPASVQTQGSEQQLRTGE